MTLKATNAPLLVFEREGGGERVLCVFNLDHEPVEWSTPDGWRVIEAVNADLGSGRLAPLAGVLLVEGG